MAERDGTEDPLARRRHGWGRERSCHHCQTSQILHATGVRCVLVPCSVHRRTDFSLATRRLASLVAQRVKRLPAMRETRVQSLRQEDPLGKEMTTHPSILAWRIPWTEEPGRLQSIQSTGSQRVEHDWTTSFSLSPGNWFQLRLRTH